ncbi:MAG: tRNA preQ1(34) S-adenosylmethionine ribosyltransferase-isomerase QueA [Verrucomicrobiota bacterium]|nr:tRNA preQ1(34) S-adenosylmethionine ribosyltransferase-isomerase QueA [Verrucomicrobiota bacterium]
MSTRLADYDYDLPPALIAQRPLPRRDESRLMVLRRNKQTIEHTHFGALENLLPPDDLLVLNNSRVLPARHFSDDGKIEFLVLEKIAPRRWKALVKPGRKFRAAVAIQNVRAEPGGFFDDGSREIVLADDLDLQRAGSMPLPPYVGRASEAEDAERYQTVFAQEEGSLAAPTAGLHFTPEILARLPHVFITLHVGTGTFRPVKTDDITSHQMHPERFAISPSSADTIMRAKRRVAVGTTTTRVLEAVWQREGKISAVAGETNIFIYPPFQFRTVDVLLTNFHLPRSTLLMLVSAFAGREFILRAYAEAVRERYRFFSYGDCMLIL